MKNFFLNTTFGTIILIVIVSVLSLMVSITISTIIFAIGYKSITTLIEYNIVSSTVTNTLLTLWTLIMIVIVLLMAAWLWIKSFLLVDAEFNTTQDEEI